MTASAGLTLGKNDKMMMQTLSRWIVVLAAALTPALALAQATGSLSSPPAETVVMTPGGVDMRTGQYQFKDTDLSIGAGGEFSFARTLNADVRQHINPFGNFSHNWDILLTERRIDIFHNNYDTSVTGPDYQVSVHFGSRSQTFRGYGGIDGYNHASPNSMGTLTFTGTRPDGSVVYTYTAGDGTVAVFRPIGSADCSAFYRCAFVSSITQPDGTLLNFSYDNTTPGGTNSTRLRSVTSSKGYALLLEYAGGGMNISKACMLNLSRVAMPGSPACPAGAVAVSYTFVPVAGVTDPSAPLTRLTSVTDPTGAVTNYTYAMSGAYLDMGFVNPGETTPWLVNRLVGAANEDQVYQLAVQQQTFADGSGYTYAYDLTPEQDGMFQVIVGGSYTDALGRTVQLHFDIPIKPGTSTNVYPTLIDYQTTPGPVTVTDQLGRVTTNHYCDPNAEANLPVYEHHRCIVASLQWSIDPEGVKTYYTWDNFAHNLLQTRRVAKPGSGLADIVASATYPCSNPKWCAKPATTTDANGNVTSYTYDEQHGGVLTETDPADTNGLRRVKRYAYVQRYAWVSNGAGGYVHGSAPMWLLSTEKTCQTSATSGNACAAGANDEIVTTYDYGPDSGPNNLWLRGKVVTAGGVSLRTCFGYDAAGNQISQTTPRGTAALTVCP